MKKFFIAVLFLTMAAYGQNKTIDAPSSFFPEQKAKVLVIGTFHFDYPGLDAHKTGENDKIDVLTDPKKAEVTELVDYIKKFNPTKIAIEATPEWKASEKLKKYKSGDFRQKRDERYQVAFRIANDLQLDTIYSIDADPFDIELSKRDSVYFEKMFQDFDFVSDDPYTAHFKNWYAYEDKLPSKMRLIDYFKRINSRESHRLMYGAYLIGDFKLDDHRGADILSIWWYNRNLRIFRKLQQISDSNDRMLVLIGNGHAAVLRQLLESSPEYEFVELEKL